MRAAARCNGIFVVSFSREKIPFSHNFARGVVTLWGAFVKILYLTDLAQQLLSLRIFSYLCTEITISARI